MDHERTQLTGEIDVLLGDDLGAASQVGERLGGLDGGVKLHTPLPS